MMAIVPMTSRPYPRARRKAALSSSLLIDPDHVADPANRVQQGRREILVDLLPQSTDLHVDRVGLWIEVVVPHRLVQHGAGHNLSLVPDEIFEKPELSWLQRDWLVGPLCSSPSQVQLQIRDPQLGHVFFHAGTSHESLQTG